MTNARCRVAALQVVVGTMLMALVVGCNGAGVLSELKVRPQPRAVSADDGNAVMLPRDEPFAVALAPSRQSPGLVGKADANSSANRDGNAEAAASVEDGGSAQAGFQLGHAFENSADRQVELNVRVHCSYETSAEATPPSPLPDAKVSLKLFARDGRNRLLRNFCLAQHSTEEGAAVSTDEKDVRFVLHLGPRESVTIFVAGNVEIETPDERSARGSIKLSGLTMEVTSTMAPPVEAAGDERS